MRSISLRPFLAGAALVLQGASAHAGANRVYLVPALQACPGPASCPRELASNFTFDAIILRTPAGKYSPPGKPSLSIDLSGVRDATGAPFNGALTARVISGRVSIPGIGTLPDDSPLAQVAPLTITLKNGKGKIAYTPPQAPSGLVTNGGGVEISDPDGHLLAVTGSQTKP